MGRRKALEWVVAKVPALALAMVLQWDAVRALESAPVREPVMALVRALETVPEWERLWVPERELG